MNVQEYVKECPICQVNKYETLAPTSLLHPLQIPSAIWGSVSMDFIEGLPKSQNYDVIIVVVDRLTKYSHFVGLKHPFNAKKVVELFIGEIVQLHGLPRSIISGRDQIFMGHFWSKLFKLLRTYLSRSTTYHP